MFTNIHNLPDPVVAALSADKYNSGLVNSSVTTLIDSPQVKILSRKHKDDISIDVSDDCGPFLELPYTICLKTTPTVNI